MGGKSGGNGSARNKAGQPGYSHSGDWDPPTPTPRRARVPPSGAAAARAAWDALRLPRRKVSIGTRLNCAILDHMMQLSRSDVAVVIVGGGGIGSGTSGVGGVCGNRSGIGFAQAEQASV